MNPLGMVGCPDTCHVPELCNTGSCFFVSSAVRPLMLNVYYAGYCGLVQTCEEDCLTSGVSRWRSSGSGNAAHSIGSRHSAGGSPGDIPHQDCRASDHLDRTLRFSSYCMLP